MQEERYVAIVDFGSSKISLCVCEAVNGAPSEVLFKEELPSEGISRGNILNPQKVAAPLKELIVKAEEKTGLKINEIVANLPRWNVKTLSLSQKTKRDENKGYINQEEILSLKDLASEQLTSKLNKNTEILYGILAQSYSTDDFIQVDESEIIGSSSSFLEGHYLGFVGAKKYKDNIDRVFNELGIAAFGYEFTPICHPESLLRKEEMDRGAALVEIGSEVTSLSIYHKGSLRYYGSFPFAGRVVSEDIHTECNISEKLAENIKLGYGFCTPERLQTLSDKTLKIETPSGDYQQLPVKYLSEIISCRMMEIIHCVMHLIGESGYADKLRSGIVLSGGGSLIHCCCSLVSNMTGLPCRIAYPENFASPKDNSLQAMLIKSCRNQHINCAIKEEAAGETTKADMELFAPNEIETKAPEPAQKEQKKVPETHQKKKPFFGKVRSAFDSVTTFGGGIFDNLYNGVGNNETEDNQEAK